MDKNKFSFFTTNLNHVMVHTDITNQLKKKKRQVRESAKI